MSNWDDTMLIECATSFVKPLELDVKTFIMRIILQ